MTKHCVRALMLFACLLVLALPAWPVDTIAGWTFETQSTDPTVGTGTAVLIGGVLNAGSGQWATGNPSGYAWNTSTYPALDANSKTAGIQFSVSTAGYTGINVSFDKKNSATASKYLRFQFSTDGGVTWDDGATGSLTSVADITFHTYSFDLGAFPSAADNPDFSFRMVTEFDSSQYTATGPTSTYAGTGTMRWDNVTVTGTPVPPLTVTVEQAAGQRDMTNGRSVNFTAVFNGTVEDFTATGVVVSGTADGPLTVSVTGTGTTYNVAVSDVTSPGTVVVSIPAGVAHCGAANPNSASTSADNSIDVFHIGPLAMVNRSVGEDYGPSAVGLWVRISGIVSNLSWTSCDVDDGSGPVHVVLGLAVVGPIADGKYVTVSGQVSSSSPRIITCSPDDEVMIY